MAQFTADAVRANPQMQQVTMPDGTTAMVRLVGDEFGHFYQAQNGYPLLRQADGYFHYAKLDADGKIVSSGIKPGGAGEAEFIRANNLDRIYEALGSEQEGAGAARKLKREAPRKASYPTTGNGRGLVVLVDYQDVKFLSPTANRDFSRMLNEPGYSEYNGTGSAADWFRENSMGQFDPTFDVYGPITLPYTMEYYGKNVNGDDQNAHWMVIHACEILDNDINFKDYDLDGDGYIDNVFLFYAGYGENLGAMAPSESVWPHSWDLDEVLPTPYVFDGVILNHYACTNERDLDDVMDGIGTFCHEFSHVLGLPDLYATNYSSAFTPGDWSVMDCGNYLNNSRTPPYYSAYERYFLEWITPRELTKAANVKLDNISTNTACMIRTEDANEYFLLENRQNKDWDAYLPYHGMLIWHIDYNSNIWKYNMVNNSKSHQYVDIEEADNIQSDGTLEGDCFPGVSNVTSFTDDTTPNMISWGGQRQEKPITDIRESNGYIYFSICGGVSEATPVVADPARDVDVASFTAAWQEGDYGYRYFLNVFTTEVSESGKTLINYVDGYENRSVGDVLEFEVTGLQPATRYHYTVVAYDSENDLYSVPSNQIDVTTLDPTFDYFIPEILRVEDLTDNSFNLAWTPLEGADTYLLDLFTKSYGDPSTVVVDFTDGVSAMPAGWQTPSNFTYGVEDYAGEAVPSLRLNSSASYITSQNFGGDVRALSFWYRGVGCTPDDRINIDVLSGNEWTRVAELEIDNAAEGAVVAFEDLPANPEWPGYFTNVRISLQTEGKGAIAIDDIKVEYGGDIRREFGVLDQGYDMGNVTGFNVAGLQPSTAYWVAVTGKSGEILSLPSVERRVITAPVEIDAVQSPLASEFKVTVDRGLVTVDGINGKTLCIYTVDGRVVADIVPVCRKAAVRLSAGLYLFTDGLANAKIIVR